MKDELLIIKYIFYGFLGVILTVNNLGVNTNVEGFFSVLMLVVVIDVLSGLRGFK